MKVFLDNLELKQVYNLNFNNSHPTASLFAYPEIFTEMFKHTDWRFRAAIDSVWKVDLPFNRLCDDNSNTVWEYNDA